MATTLKSLALPIYDARDGSDATGWHQWLGTKEEYEAKYPGASYDQVLHVKKQWRKYPNETTEAFERRGAKLAREMRREKILRCVRATDDQRREWLVDDLDFPSKETIQIFRLLFPCFRQPIWPTRKMLDVDNGSVDAQQARVAAETADIVARRKCYLNPDYLAKMNDDKKEYALSQRSDKPWMFPFLEPHYVVMIYPMQEWKRTHGDGYFVNMTYGPTESQEQHKERVEREQNDVVQLKRRCIQAWKALHPDAAEVEATGDDVYAWEKARYLELGGTMDAAVAAERNAARRQKRQRAE